MSICLKTVPKKPKLPTPTGQNMSIFLETVEKQKEPKDSKLIRTALCLFWGLSES